MCAYIEGEGYCCPVCRCPLKGRLYSTGELRLYCEEHGPKMTMNPNSSGRDAILGELVAKGLAESSHSPKRRKLRMSIASPPLVSLGAVGSAGAPVGAGDEVTSRVPDNEQPSVKYSPSVAEVAKMINSCGFNVEGVYGSWILAVHDLAQEQLLVRVLAPSELAQFPKINGITFAQSDFSRFLRRLSSHLKERGVAGRRGSSELNQGTLTDFGWHAFYPDIERRAALDWAISFYGVDHIVQALDYLCNMWGNNINYTVEVQEAPCKDGSWLRSEHSHFHRQWALTKRLRNEFEGIMNNLPAAKH